MAGDDKLELVFRVKSSVVRFAVPEGATRIGRRSQSDLWLPSHSVSKVHAIVTREGEKFFVEDQGSTNGTLLNGARVTRAAMHPGDVIQVGGYDLYLLYAGAPLPEKKVVRATAGPITLPVLATAGAILLFACAYAAFALLAEDRQPVVGPIAVLRPTTPREAFDAGVAAYLGGELKEAERLLRVAEGPGATQLLDCVLFELEEVSVDPRLRNVERRHELYRTVLRAGPPAHLRKELRVRLGDEVPPPG